MARNPNTAAGAAGPGMPRELVRRIMFVLGALIVFRLGTFIPVPGVNPVALVELMKQTEGTIVGVFNMFSGGALGRFSLFALGIMPYITASIIIQLMSSTIPTLKELKKEGESGRRKITQYTRYFTVILALFQSFGIASMLQGQAMSAATPVILNPGPGFLFTAMVSLTCGTMFLMWLGEQVTERGVGNGISIIIFAGIVAGLPSGIGSFIEMANTGQVSWFFVVIIFLLAIAVTMFVVFVERGMRKITVNYAQKGGRKAYQSHSTHLPLKLNMAGVIPAIFASSLILFPATLAAAFGDQWRGLQALANRLTMGDPTYEILYGVLIAGFCFFYTAIQFNSQETADNLKRQGALIPGIRPGNQTASYLDDVISKLTTWGAAYLVLICLIPDFLIAKYNVPFYFGGTSLLIVVVVAMDIMAQISTHMTSHRYEDLMKKAKLKKVGRRGRR